jgi:hypothetical protein
MQIYKFHFRNAALPWVTVLMVYADRLGCLTLWQFKRGQCWWCT